MFVISFIIDIFQSCLTKGSINHRKNIRKWEPFQKIPGLRRMKI